MSIRPFLRLARIQTAPLTALAPVMGATLAAGFSPGRDFTLFLAGLGCHIFGFAHNEVQDRRVDRLAPELAEKPLVEGSIEPIRATRGAFTAAGLALVAMATLSADATLILCVAIAAAYAYNRTSKRLPYVDWAVASSMGLLVVAGGVAAGGMSTPAWIVAGLLTLQLLVQNTLAHLKDLQQDQAARGTNAALHLGVVVRGNRVMVGRAFRIYLVPLRLAHTALALLGVLLLEPGPQAYAAAAMLVTQGFALSQFRVLLWAPPAPRQSFLAAFFRHEMPTLLAATILLVSALGWVALVPYVLLPLAWAVATVRLLHGGRMPAL